MSEYQYYEFQAIERPLTNSEFEKVKGLSSRGDVSRNHAVFTYNYGDFRYDPIKILAKHFDIMLYFANWGTRRLAFRLPKNLVNLKEIKQYCLPETITACVIDEYVIIDIAFNDEGADWVDQKDLLCELLPLRDNLLEGNYQALYIAWLGALTQDYCDDIDDSTIEPPLPHGLKTLSKQLARLIDFLSIDIDLVETAAAESDQITNVNIDPKQWLSKLPSSSRDELLLQLLDNDPTVSNKLKKILLEIAQEHSPCSIITLKKGQRTIKELLDAAEQLTRKKKEKQKLKKLRAKEAQLKTLAQQEPQLWTEVFNQINTKNAKGYEQAVKILRDLKELAHYLRTTEQFALKIKKIQHEYSRYSALKTKIIDHNLI